MSKGAQRTKGNKKPSSSANAFNLFLKYSGTNDQPAFSDLANYSSLTDESNHEIFVAIKKCSKKDIVTKTKGLKDILELFTSNEDEDYSFLLKHWIKVFLNLSYDNDFQVREVTLSTFEQINKLVKSQLQPYLKQIVPVWLCLTGDPHGNVAKFATQAFSATFGKNKLNEVFLFTKEQIIANVDIILFKTNYNEKKNDIRLIPGAFYSMIVLSKIAKDDKYLNDELIKLLDNELFWKYSKFSDNNVQVSWFNLIGSLLEIKFDMMKNYSKKINQQTFNRLDEKNTSLQESIWKVLFALMKLSEDCFDDLNYDKVYKSFVFLLRKSSFNRELLNDNFDLVFKYFLFKNENTEEFINTLFALFQQEILTNKDQILAIDLYFSSLLYLIRNPQSTLSAQVILSELINHKLKTVIEQLSSDSKRLQELFKKFVKFSSNLKSLKYDEQVLLVNHLILESIRNKLESSLSDDVFDLQSIKSLLNIIFNLKSYQSKIKLSLYSSNAIESLEFIKYKFDFYERTDDRSTKNDLLRAILRIVYDRSDVKISANYIEFLNYLVQFSSYLDVLDDEAMLIRHFKTIAQQLTNDRCLKIQLAYVIHQITLRSSINFREIVDLECSENVFSFIFTMQLIKDSERISSVSKDILQFYEVLFEEFVNMLSSRSDKIKKSIDDIDFDDDHDDLKDDKFIAKFIGLLTHETELNLMNAIYSILDLKLDESIYRDIFNKLIQLNYDEVHVLVYLILDRLNRNDRILSVETIESLMFNFIEFTTQKVSIELNKNLWSDVLFKSLKQDSAHSLSVIDSLSSKFKQLIALRKSITFEQLNSIISNIYLFVTKLSSFDEYSNAESINKIVRNILLDADEFDQFKESLNEKVFEFLWIKNDFTDCDFNTANLTGDDLTIPHLVHVSYASLKITKLLDCNGEQLNMKNLLNESTDQQIANLWSSKSDLEYLFNNSNLSYCYLKILSQIYSYGMSLTNPGDLIESYIHFYESLYVKLDEKFVIEYANRTYQSNHENTWTVASLHYLLNIVGTDNVFNFESIYKSLKINNFSLIMRYIAKKDLELFLEQVIQYNLVSKTNYPDNFEDIHEYLNIIAICLKNFQVTIDYERTLTPVVNSIMCYRERIQAKEKENQLYFDLSTDQLMSQLNDSQFIDKIVSIINFLDSFVKRSAYDLSSRFSDFLFYSLLRWTEILNQDLAHLLNNHLCNYFNRLFNLINDVAFLMQLNVSNLRKTRSNWLENYSFKINERLFRFYLKLSRQEIKFVHYDMVNSLGKCLVEMDNDCLIKVQFKYIHLDEFDDWKPTLKVLGIEDDEADLKLPIKLERLFNLLSSLLMKRNSIYSLTSHQLIKNYLNYLANELNRDSDFLANLEEKLFLKPPDFLLNLMDRVNEELHQNDSNFNEQTNSLKIIYFLLWEQLLEFWSRLNEQIKCTLANYLKDRGVIEDLFLHFNDILPIDKQLLEVYYKHGLTNSKIKEYFLKLLHLESASLWSVNTLYHLSCQIYLKSFIKMPTTMRLWINTATNQLQIKEFTLKFVSEIVIQNELKMIQDQASSSLENLRLKVRQSTNEVLTSYSFEDCKIELTLTLPSNYPIGLIKINAGERVGVDVSKWRAWELQLHTFLAENGSVFDGIVVWLNNIRKTLECCEECMICFYVLQSSNYQLPKILCKFCRKKFHRVCLSKWFAKSSKRSCPLCRNDM